MNDERQSQKVRGGEMMNIIFLLLCMFLPKLSLGKEAAPKKDTTVKIYPVTIGFQADETFVPKNFRERLSGDWASFCEKFGVNFQIGKGPQGRGIASKVDCLDLKITGDSAVPPSFSEGYGIIFGWNDKGLSVSIYFTNKGQKESHLLGSFEFAKQFTPDLFFTSPQASHYVMSRIYKRLPAAWNVVLQKADLQWQLAPLEPSAIGILQPARKMALFSLRYDATSKTFIPTLYAIAQPATGDDRKVIDREGGDPLEVRWIIEPRQKKIRLWAQEIFNPLEKEVDPSFITMRDSRSGDSLLEGYALEGLKSSVIQVRYGKPFPKGSTVVSQASKVEILADVGKGILDGLTVGYEFSPRETQKEGTDEYSFTWSRLEAGWSFMLGEPQTIERFASRFKLAPKVGLVNLDAYFPLNATENLEFATVAAFKVKSQIDMGGELAWELDTMNYRLRVWGMAHISGYILGGANPSKISNQRAGGDISYDVYKTSGGLRFGVVGFGYIDWVTLQQDVAPQLGANLLATSTTASGASYNVTYIGLGLSATW